MCQVLADKLVHQTAGAHLEVGPGLVGGAIADGEFGARRLPGGSRRSSWMAFSIEEMGIHPGAAPGEEVAAAGGERRVVHRPGHLSAARSAPR